MSYRSRLSSSFPLTLTALGALALATAPAGAEEDRLRITPKLEVTQSFETGDVEGEKTVLPDLQPNEDRSDRPAFSAPFEKDRNARRFEVAPAVEAEGKFGSLSFSAVAGMRMRSSSQDRDGDTTGDRAQFQATYQITPLFSATARGSFDKSQFDGFDSDLDNATNAAPLQVEDGRPDRRDASGTLGLQYLLSPTSQLQASFSAITRDYEMNRSGRRDFGANAVSLSYVQSPSARDRLSLSLSYQTIDFPTIRGTLTTEQTDRVGVASVGWVRQIAPMWTGRLDIGARLLKSRDKGILSLEGPTVGDGALDERDTGFNGGLELVRETDMSRTALSFRQETRPSGGQGTSVDSQLLRLLHRQRLTRTFTLSLRASYQRDRNVNDRVSPQSNAVSLETVPFELNGVQFVDSNGRPLTVPVVDASGRRVGDCPNGRRAVDFIGINPVCPAVISSGVDDTLLTFGATLDWQLSPSLQMYLSAEYREQDRDGTRPSVDSDGASDLPFDQDRTSTRFRLGLRYAYDFDLF